MSEEIKVDKTKFDTLLRKIAKTQALTADRGDYGTLLRICLK
jgi:hypothetical protein